MILNFFFFFFIFFSLLYTFLTALPILRFMTGPLICPHLKERSAYHVHLLCAQVLIAAKVYDTLSVKDQIALHYGTVFTFYAKHRDTVTLKFRNMCCYIRVKIDTQLSVLFFTRLF